MLPGPQSPFSVWILWYFGPPLSQNSLDDQGTTVHVTLSVCLPPESCLKVGCWWECLAFRGSDRRMGKIMWWGASKFLLFSKHC